MAKPRIKPRIKAPESSDETREALSRWWHSNGRFVFVGLLVAGISIGGWSMWQHSREQHAVSAAEGYAAFVKRLEAGGNIGEAVGIPELPSQVYGDTIYLSFAYLRRAKVFIDRGEYEKATADLRWVARNSVLPQLSELAYIRLSRVLIILGKSEEALKLLDEAEFSQANRAMVEDVRGDVLISLEDFEEGLKAYQAAWKASPNKPGFLRIKLTLMGRPPE